MVKALTDVSFAFKDTKLKLHNELGIEFHTCPVAGHFQHGQVERRIRSIQDSLSESGWRNKTLHATGLQTLMKLVENQLNNFPLGYSYSRDQDNLPLLKMLTPNMLKLGRINERALDGPMKLPTGGELLDRVQQVYEAWYSIWSNSYVPKLMYQPKWWKQDRDLQEQDIVMFQKRESELDTAWTLGRVDQLVRGRDGLSRRAIIKYTNPNEDFARFSDRHVRSLIRIWSIDDQCIDEDLAELQRRLKTSTDTANVLDELILSNNLGNSKGHSSFKLSEKCLSCSICCCKSHCNIIHSVNKSGSPRLPKFFVGNVVSSVIPSEFPECLSESEEEVEITDEESFNSLISSLSLNLD